MNDYLVWHSTGLCRIVDISRDNFGGMSNREYYVLETVYGHSMEIYIPTDMLSAAIRPILSRDEMFELIEFLPVIGSEWIRDDGFRKAMIREILLSCSIPNMLNRSCGLVSSRKQSS